MAKFGAHSTQIIKQNQHCFPLKQLYAMLKACFKNHPAEKWVAFISEISRVRLIAVAYAWSKY
jgi:hypothetical protein